MVARYMRGRKEKKSPKTTKSISKTFDLFHGAPPPRTCLMSTRVIRPSRCFHVASLGRYPRQSGWQTLVARRRRSAPGRAPSPIVAPDGGCWGRGARLVGRNLRRLRAGGPGVPGAGIKDRAGLPRGLAAVWRHTRSSTAPGRRPVAAAEKRSLSPGPPDNPAFRAEFSGGQQAAQSERTTRPPKSRRSRRVPMWTVDCWPVANVHTRHLGASRGRYPPSGVNGRGHPPPWPPIPQRAEASRPECPCGGMRPWELSGGKWMAAGIAPPR
jgi:hypothetical protein